MKKNIIALAIASAVAAPIAMADAPVIYGQVNMAVEQFNVKDNAGKTVKSASGTQVNSVASRIGVKGSEDLGNGLKAIYQLEFEVGIDKDDGKIKGRNQFVGLAGGFGTVLAGRHDVPTKMIQATDLFDDGVADNSLMAGGLGADGKGMETRISQALVYVSPSFSGVKLMAALSPKENSGDLTKESELTDLYSVAIAYGSKNNGLYLAAGMDQASKAALPNGVNETAEHVRVVAQYRTGGLVANVMYQDFAGKALKDKLQGGTNIQANLGYQMGKFMPKVKVSSIDYSGSTYALASTTDKAKDATNYAVGLDYALGKKTTSYVTYTMLENVYGVKKQDTDVISVGLLHKF